MTPERLAKRIARSGLCSRREAERWILEGRIRVNGKPIATPAFTVGPNDLVEADGEPLPLPGFPRLFLYHKPKGLMTTHRDPQRRPTVFASLPPSLPRLVSVGRLDFNTEGLLLLTNDGELANALSHPSMGWKRTYRVRVFGEVTQAQLDDLARGVSVLAEGRLMHYGPVDARLEERTGKNGWLRISIFEGKNREIRRICEHLGLAVNRLIRTDYGPFSLGALRKGEVKEVARGEVARYLPAKSGVRDENPGGTPQG